MPRGCSTLAVHVGGSRAQPKSANLQVVEDRYSTFLFATPRWTEAGRLFDFGGTYDAYNESSSPDAVALAADWRVAGLLLWAALLGAAATRKA